MGENEMGAMRRPGAPGAGLVPKVLTNTRAIYEELCVLARKKKLGIKPVLSYLRLEASLQGSGQTISFNVLTNQTQGQSQTPTENRLNIGDLFTTMQIGFFIEKIGTSTTYSALTATDFARGVLNTYPNANVYTGSNEAANLMNIYNGNLNLTIIDKVVIKNFPMYKFYRVPTEQKGVIVYGTAAAPGAATQDTGWENENYGFINMTPAISIEGSQNIQFTINMPAAISTAGTSSSNNAVLVLYGFLLQNGASFNR